MESSAVEQAPGTARTTAVWPEAPGTAPPAVRVADLAQRVDVRVLKSLRKIIRAVDLHSRKLTAQFSLTTPQLVCLLTIHEHETITTGALARDVQLSASTVVGILDRLEARGFITRTRNQLDRRQVDVELTAEGATVVRNAPSPLQETLVHGLMRLSPAEQATISAVLEQIVHMMEADSLDAAPILDTGTMNRPDPAA